MATPPARVEFWMCTMSSFFFRRAETKKEATTAPHRDTKVLARARMRCPSVVSTALKEGHMIHRKMVPGRAPHKQQQQ